MGWSMSIPSINRRTVRRFNLWMMIIEVPPIRNAVPPRRHVFFGMLSLCVVRSLTGSETTRESGSKNQKLRIRNYKSDSTVLVSDSVRDLCCEHGMLSRNFGLLLYNICQCTLTECCFGEWQDIGPQQEPSELMAETASPGTECLMRLTLQKLKVYKFCVLYL